MPQSDVIFELQARHTRLAPVFVIGYARSGTSLTCRLLRRYLKVSFGTESQFIMRYYRKLHVYGDLTYDANARGLIGDIARERFFQRSRRNWGFAFNQEQAFMSLGERSYAGVLDAIFGQLAEHNQMVRWGDKTPVYVNDLPILNELFPKAQFIHVYRDGRDVTLSMRKAGFGPCTACETAAQWMRALELITSFGRSLPPDRFHELRYEELIDAPGASLTRLADFLGIDDGNAKLRTYIDQHVRQEVRQDNHDKWRHTLSRRDVERFEGVAGDALSRMGYGLMFNGQGRRVSKPERLYWRWRAHAARLILPAAWSDNWYKLALRLRSIDPRFSRPSLRVLESMDEESQYAGESRRARAS